jgi:hypothetical protein
MAAAFGAVLSAWRRIVDSGMPMRSEGGALWPVHALISLTHPTKRHFAGLVADYCAAAAASHGPERHYSRLHKAECVEQKRLLLDVLPPVTNAAALARWAGHDGGLPQRLALAIYEDRAYERLPILADALEEAGCDDTDILSHLRSPGPHARGCWPVDALLGKS